MKVMLVTGQREKYPLPKIHDWHYMLPLLEKKIGKIDVVLKKDWPFFYNRYLRDKPEIIICVGIIGAFVCFLKRIGFLNSIIINDWTDDWAEVMSGRYGYRNIAFLERYMIKQSDFIITPSKRRYDIAKKMGKKIFLRPHGTDIVFSKKKANLKGKFKILYVGSQEESKNVGVLVRAVKGLDVDLYLVGKTNPNLLRIASYNVHFLGFRDPKELYIYYNSADLLALTMDNDSTLKIEEYKKARKPIIGFDGRLRNIFVHKENAYLTLDFREGINYLIKDKKLLLKLKKNSSKFKVYNWNEVSEKYIILLKAIYTKRKSV